MLLFLVLVSITTNVDLRLHHCGPGNLDDLARISRDTFTEAFEALNNPDDFKHYLETAFSRHQLLSELQDPHTDIYFVYSGGELVGYFKLNEKESQTDIADKDSIELERIYVSGAYQGKQIGKWMLERIIEIGHQRRKSYLWLGVWEKNTGAIRFYEKYGFAKFGTHPYYIGKDRQTDWLMRLDLATLGSN